MLLKLSNVIVKLKTACTPIFVCFYTFITLSLKMEIIANFFLHITPQVFIKFLQVVIGKSLNSTDFFLLIS